MATKIPSVLLEAIDKTGVITLLDATRIFAILEGKYFSAAATARDMKSYYNKIYANFKGKLIHLDNYKTSVINQKDLILYLSKLIRNKKLVLAPNIDKEVIRSILTPYETVQVSLEDIQVDKSKETQDLEKENIQLRHEIDRLKSINRDIELEVKGYKLLCLQQDDELKQLR